MELNKIFKDGLWSSEINVRDFVSHNITPYYGDASFLEGPTERTKAVWNRCLEALAEVLRILDRRHVVAHLVEALGKGAAAQLLLAEGEVDMIESGVFVVDEDGGAHRADVGHLAPTCHDDRARRDDLLAIGILLAQGQGVLAGRHIDADGAAEVGEGLDGTIEARVLTLL